MSSCIANKDKYENDEKKNKIKVVSGNGDLEISPVEKHLEVEKPHNSPEKDKIIIPSEKKTEKE